MKIKYHRLIVIWMLSIIVLGGCAPSRQLVFSELQPHEIKSGANVVSLSGLSFELEIDNSEWKDNFEEGTKQRMRDQLTARLHEKGLRTTENGPASYSLKGRVVAKETLTHNPWAIPAWMITIGLMPIGPFIGSTMPMFDIAQQVVADIVVIELPANSEILVRQYNESINYTVNGFKYNIERGDRELAALEDRTMGKIAFDVEDAIERSRQDSAAVSDSKAPQR
jgi:hypothetical protein